VRKPGFRGQDMTGHILRTDTETCLLYTANGMGDNGFCGRKNWIAVAGGRAV